MARKTYTPRRIDGLTGLDAMLTADDTLEEFQVAAIKEVSAWQTYEQPKQSLRKSPRRLVISK